MTQDPRPFRPCVGMMLLNPRNHVLVAQRRDFISDAWQMPQGGIDEGESPLEAAYRELREEIGTNEVKLITESLNWHSYTLPFELSHKIWDGKYQGQTQKWFLFQFLGDDSSIDVYTGHEFTTWKWVELSVLCELVVPFKREIYEQIIAEFAAHIPDQLSF